MKDFYTVDPEMGIEIVKARHIKLSALSAECGYTSSWLTHALKNGRIPRRAYNKLKEFGIDLEPAVIARPEEVLVKTDLGKIVRIINLSYKFPVWVIAQEERLSKEKVIAHINTWEQNHYGLTKEDLTELLRNWENNK